MPQSEDMLANIRSTFEHVLATIEKKNHDYSGDGDPFANAKSALIIGVGVERGLLVRILDKLMRVSNLLDHDPRVTEESMRDTLSDAIGYLALLKAYVEIDHARQITEVD